MARPYTEPIILLDAVVADGQSRAILVAGYEFVEVIIVATGTATGTIKVRATDLNADDVDFTSAISGTNLWENVALKNLNAGQILAGDTGVVFNGAGATVVRRTELNDNFARNIAIDLSNWTQGTFTVRLVGVRADAF